MIIKGTEEANLKLTTEKLDPELITDTNDAY